MSGSACRASVAVLAAALALLPALAGGESLEGRWKLVEQNYGKGKMNLADLEAPVLLEFNRDLHGGGARIWTSGDETRPLSWPAYVADRGPLPVELITVSADPSSDGAYTRYRVKPSPTDDLVLLIVEEYAVTEDGDALVGSATVTFTVGEEERGSFVLHRRFERVK
jgi:hypothetical protein